MAKNACSNVTESRPTIFVTQDESTSPLHDPYEEHAPVGFYNQREWEEIVVWEGFSLRADMPSDYTMDSSVFRIR